MGYNGLMDTLIKLAVLPGLIIIVYIYGKDKVEKEPMSLIIRLLILGAVSCVPVIFWETVNDSMIAGLAQNSAAHAIAEAFFVAGLCEEACKYLFLRIGSWKDPAFNYRFDGIVYGVSVAMGFAIVENINYVMQFGIMAAYQRAFTAVPLHAFCGAVMGILYSYSKKAYIDGNRAKYVGFSILAFLVPFFIHGLYDMLLMLNTSTTYMLSYVLVIYLFVKIIRMVNKMSNEDRISGFYDR